MNKINESVNDLIKKLMKLNDLTKVFENLENNENILCENNKILFNKENESEIKTNFDFNIEIKICKIENNKQKRKENCVESRIVI